MNQEIINTLFHFLPEITLFTVILTLNIISFFRKDDSPVKYFIFIGGLLLCFAFSLLQANGAAQLLFGGLIVTDPLAYFGKVILSISVFVISLLFINKDSYPGQFNKILLFEMAGMFAVSSVNFLMLMFSLEIMSITLLLLIAGYMPKSVKYFIYGAAATGVMLFGFTLMYGITGSSDYYEISRMLSSEPINAQMLTLSVVMILGGMFFRILLPPFNFAFPVFAKEMKISHTALFLVPALITGILVITRFTLTVFHDSNSFVSNGEGYQFIPEVNWFYMVSIACGFAVLAGNLVILWQYDLKKIITFITIAQAGYLLFGIAAASHEGLTATLYSIITTGSCIFGLLYASMLIKKKYHFTKIDELKGIGRSDPFLYIMFLLFILLAAGLPFTGGFAARVMLFEALASQGKIVLIAVAILSSIGAYYFIFRSSVSIFRNPLDINICKTETFHKIVLFVLLLPAILPSVVSEDFIRWIRFCSAIFGI